MDRDLIYRQWLFGAILIKMFSHRTEETPFGEREEVRKSDKNRTFPPFPYGFLLRLLFPSPFSPLVRFFADTK